MHDTGRQMQFDAKRFLTVEFGSPVGIVRTCAQFGVVAPQLSATQKWFQRESIPGEWLPVLLDVLKRKGCACDLTQYVRGAE